MSVYLDYNASAPIDERVLDLMVEVYKNSVGNADSRTHNFGENARSIVENARSKLQVCCRLNRMKFFLLAVRQKAIISQFKDLKSMRKKVTESILLLLLLSTRRCWRQ